MRKGYEGQKYRCGWSQEGGRFAVWVLSAKIIRGEGATFDDAVHSLVDAIGMAYGDMEADFDWDRPTPWDYARADYCRPELKRIVGYTGSGPIGPVNDIFSEGQCKMCHGYLGSRTDTPIWIERKFDNPKHVDGLYVGRLNFFSERFITLLTAEEKSQMEFYPAITPPSKSLLRRTQRMFELRGISNTPWVRHRKFVEGGWRCQLCGYKNLRYSPSSNAPAGAFVCREHLPNPLPGCFLIGTQYDICLCMTNQRWEEMRGRKEVRGVEAWPLGVVGLDEADLQPELPGYAKVDEHGNYEIYERKTAPNPPWYKM